MASEFKEFALKGSVMDMAVGIIIGGAFGKIIASLVNDVLMPVIGLAMGGVSFTDLYTALDGNTYESLAAAEEAGAAIMKYGAFIQNIVDFVIIAFVIFMMIRTMNNMRKQEEEAPEAPPEPSDEVKILAEIRDSLAKS
jgi:large conductance mechanosensitive channel